MSHPSVITIRTVAPARAVLLTALLGLTLTVACGSKTPNVPPPPPPTLQISCPAPVLRDATSPQGTDVHFDAPQPTGGVPPYAVECSPGSSNVFPIGESTVTCKATDAAMVQTSCMFLVTVRVAQTLRFTKYLAYGDSITDGSISLRPLIMLAEPDAYPYKLQGMLTQAYPAQTFDVAKSGVGGETTVQGAVRLPGELDRVQPEVLLLLEGINAVRTLRTSAQVTAIRSMLNTARTRRVEVIIATVMPISAAREADHRGTLEKIIELNVEIFRLAEEFHIQNVVDLYALFDANPQLLGADGLHPTAEGQTRIAEAFRQEIARRYESRATISTQLRDFSARNAR
jgi:lysophospholipase L1-like esterase